MAGQAQVAVFVDGCFWHGCPEHGTWSKTNTDWWKRKIQSNIERDVKINSQLHELGWIPIRVWEHEDPREAAQHITCIVRSRSNVRN